MSLEPKRRWPRATGLEVAEQVLALLAPACERIAVAGSLRRGKPDVGDVEVIYIPRVVRWPDPADMFAEMEVNLAEMLIVDGLGIGFLMKRLNAEGREAWGPKNKLARHVQTGMPVDLFAATEANWFNYLVCRKGPAESNGAIASEAQRRGWKWNPYGSGFSRGGHDDIEFEERSMDSEAAVFRFVGLAAPPWVEGGNL
jgi:DNA polymerase/3'-5' exonuclease PolX